MKRLLIIILLLCAAPVFASANPEAADQVEAAGKKMVTLENGDVVTRAEAFRRQDPGGGLMTLTAVPVVMLALAALYLIFWAIGAGFKRSTANKAKKAAAALVAADVEVSAPLNAVNPFSVSGDVYAAIAIAIYQYSRDLHDVENTVLTINRGAKAYSPWSSKIYGLRQIPEKR